MLGDTRRRSSAIWRKIRHSVINVKKHFKDDVICTDCIFTEGRPSGKILVLGNYDHDQEWSETQKSSKDAKVGHHSQYYTNGTLCDLTGGYRKAEIRVSVKLFKQ